MPGEDTIILPAQEAFRSGQLLMPDDVVSSAVRDAASWGDYTLNWVLLVVSALFLAVSIRTIYHMFPHFLKCLFRWRWNLTLEASIQLCRSRDVIAYQMIVPFCLIADRFALLDPRIAGICPPQRTTLVVLGVMALYAFIKFLIFKVLDIKFRVNAFQHVRNATRTYFTIMTSVMIVTVGILSLLMVSDVAIRQTLIVELCVLYGITVIRKGQILSSSCNPLSTFLYLCGLEILPTALLVAMNLPAIDWGVLINLP